MTPAQVQLLSTILNSSLVAAIGSALVAALLVFLQKHTKSAALRDAEASVARNAPVVVASLMQTVVSDMKAQGGGMLTAAQSADVKAMAIAGVEKVVGDVALETLAKANGSDSTVAMIDHHIEAAVQSTKTASAPSTAATLPMVAQKGQAT